MAHIPLIEQFKSSIGAKKPIRTQSRKSTRSPFKPNFAGKKGTQEVNVSTSFALEPVMFVYRQPQVSFDFRNTPTRRNSASPNKRRARSTREADIEANPSLSVIDFYPDATPEPAKHPSPHKIVLPKLPILKCEPQLMISLGGDLLSSKTRSRYTYETDESGLTEKQMSGTTRLFWRRRVEVRTGPLLIVNFEGVIGDISSDGVSSRLLIRDGLIRASSCLSDRFQIALMFSHPRKLSRRLLSELIDLGFDLDAAYKRRSAGKVAGFVTDYEQVVRDFGVEEVGKMVLVVGSLRMEQGEVVGRSGMDLVYEPAASLRNRIQVRGYPSPSTPTCFLIPSLLAQENYLCPSLDSIASLLTKYQKLSGNRGGLQAAYTGVSKMSMGDVKKVEVAEGGRAGVGGELAGGKILVLVHSRLALKRCCVYDRVVC